MLKTSFFAGLLSRRGRELWLNSWILLVLAGISLCFITVHRFASQTFFPELQSTLKFHLIYVQLINFTLSQSNRVNQVLMF